LSVESLNVATRPVLITIDFHLLIRVGFSCEFHLASQWTGRIMIGLTKDIGTSQDTLWPPVLEKHGSLPS
jgi:hypothetical protein